MAEELTDGRPAAVGATDDVVEEGVVVSTKSRTQGDTDYEAVGGALDPKPTVVLVNRDSASAAEILTAALQVYDLAEAGDPVARRVVEESARALGRLVSLVGNLVMPQKVIISGEGVRLAEVGAQPLAEAVAAGRHQRP